MPQAAVADVLERCARELDSVAFDYREPRRSAAQADELIGEVERIADTMRGAVRGSMLHG